MTIVYYPKIRTLCIYDNYGILEKSMSGNVAETKFMRLLRKGEDITVSSLSKTKNVWS